ncbi:unnamed protein product, partial [Discosporangium mesarthrocarpum]
MSTLLFDAGEGTVNRITSMNIKASSITHIFISHMHHDHVMGLPGVL